jgi:hypothetical protein
MNSIRREVRIVGFLPPPEIPMFCPVCTSLVGGIIDELAYKRSSCCSDCEEKWADPNREKWISGWRPTIED